MSHNDELATPVETCMDGEIIEDIPPHQPKLITPWSHQERIVLPTQKDTTGVLVIE